MVSDLGRIKSLARPTQRKEIMLRPGDSYGYNFVVLRRGHGPRHFKVHRLVAIAFLPNPKNKRTVNHKNMIKKDNRIENLEWATDSENLKHAFLNGRRAMVGIRNGRAKFTARQVRSIRRNTTLTLSGLAKWYGVAYHSIRKIKRNISYKNI